MRRICLLRPAALVALALTALLLDAVQPVALRAESYPDRPVRFLTNSAPGSDYLVRAMADEMSKTLGQPIVVENKLGGSGLVGPAAAVNAPPDGYTVLFAIGATLTIVPHVIADMSFDPLKDLIPVALIGSSPLVLIVNPEVTPVTSAEELMRRARANPGMVTYSSYGIGSYPGILTPLVAENAKVKMVPIVYRASSAAYLDLFAGRLTTMLDQVTNASPNIEAGKVRPLATTSANRIAQLPGVPTLMEIGLMDFEAVNWTGAYVPANTPPEIVQRLATEFSKALASEAVKNRFAKFGTTVGTLTGKAFADFHAAEYHRWGDIVRRLQIKPQ
jgi:tripartite-type tricarboxylate transporter receptor subunit TctC